MKAHRVVLVAPLLAGMMSVSALAGYTTVQWPASGESSHKQILEGIYGGTFVGSGTNLGYGQWTVFSNGTVTARRVGDSGFITLLNLLYGTYNSGDDDLWEDGIASATAEARFAGYSQEFGYDVGAGYIKLFDVVGSGFGVTGSGTVTFGASITWEWARANDSDAGLNNPHWSEETSNSDGLDHMVTYHVTGIPGVPTTTNVWLVYWEDISGGGSDWDYNDLAVEIKATECLDSGDCDDDNECTDNLCNADGACEYPGLPLSTPCEADGDLCTIDHCDGNGICVTYDEVDCQDPLPPCEGGEVCNPATGQCDALPDAPLSTPCEADGERNLCTIDHCDGFGECVTYDEVQCPEPAPPCEGGERCDPDTGQCVPEPDAPLSTPCEADGDLCTIDHCDGNGTCVTYDNVDCKDPVPPCEGGEECNPATGQCEELPDAPLSTPCEVDGNLCTIDHCDGSGACVTYDNVDCQDPVPPCEGGEECNPATGQCDALPDAPLSTHCEFDGNLCTIDHCNGTGACVTYDNVDCQDPVPPCEGGQYCEPTTGQCVDNPDAPVSTACNNDGNLCTGDHCDGNGACVDHPPYDVHCQGPVPPCEGGQYCEPTTGQCVDNPDATVSTPCNTDANLCTGEHCDGNGACVDHPPYDVHCQDPVPPCEGGQHCEPATGQCVNNADAPLSTPCTTCPIGDTECNNCHCNGTGACVNNPELVSTSCNSDNNKCTGEHCNGSGYCVDHPPYDVHCRNPVPPCEAGERCNTATGQCDALPDAPLSTPCEKDGNVCTQDHCNGNGQCVYLSNICGACCFEDGSCTNGLTQVACEAAGGEFKGIGKVCLGDSNHDGKDDLCVPPIPTVSEWGLAALTLLLLSGGKVYFGRRRNAVDAARD